MEYHVLNLGAGVQSTALYLLACDGKLNIEHAIFADTQDEPADVYTHLEWLKSLKGPPIHVRTAGKLGDDLIKGRNSTGQRFTSIPAFVKTEGQKKEGIIRRQCTNEYKIEVCERFIRREILGLAPRKWVPKGTIVHQYFGISTDERQRAERAKKRFETMKWTTPVYPLLEMNWSRRDCLAYLKDRVPHVVPKSACVFCPFRTNQSWAELKATDPESWRRAVEVDNGIRADGAACRKRFRQELYLHRSCVPLVQLDFSRITPNTLDPMTTGECTDEFGLIGVACLPYMSADIYFFLGLIITCNFEPSTYPSRNLTLVPGGSFLALLRR